jgi:hypothetical protein
MKPDEPTKDGLQFNRFNSVQTECNVTGNKPTAKLVGS